MIPVPLGGDLGKQSGQVVDPGEDRLPGAHRTAGPQQGPGLDLRLPLMAPVAAPPDLPVAAGGDLSRGEVPVAEGVPLPEQQRVRDRHGDQLLSSKKAVTTDWLFRGNR